MTIPPTNVWPPAPWYKVFWQYLHRYKVRLEIGEGYDVPLVRERDQVFMEVALPHNPHRNWPFLNCVCHHKGIFFLSQATHMDGITIRQSCLTQDTGLSSPNMTFPKQQPTAANFEVWCRTLYTISSLALRLCVPLGWLCRLPYDRHLWRVSGDCSIVVCVDTKKEISLLYLPSTTSWRLNGGFDPEGYIFPSVWQRTSSRGCMRQHGCGYSWQ